jgi:GGDEF domain-containing protein
MKISHEQLHTFYDQIEGGVALVTRKGERLAFANKSLLALYHCANEAALFDLAGGHYRGLMDEEDYESLESLTKGEDQDRHFMAFHYTGDQGVLQLEGCVSLFEEDTDLGPCYILHLISEDAYFYFRRKDDLTKLSGLQEFYQQALVYTKTYLERGILDDYVALYFNIVNFKEYNYLNGEKQGDKCITLYASVLKKVFHASLIGHVFADNFCILTRKENVNEKVMDVVGAMDAYINNTSIRLKVGLYELHDENSEDALRHAFDNAKVAATSITSDSTKSYALFNDELSERVHMRFYIVHHFYRALEKERLKCIYSRLFAS